MNAYGPYAMTEALETWSRTQPDAFEELRKQAALGYIGDSAKDIAPAVGPSSSVTTRTTSPARSS
ncbi:hypothetical protein SAMN05443668_103547 [Cryptosporangium aurantiacum]|uniref:Uncharacterized protein n=1 Tax=Cryptosporangium aurantiacum TaxID=134849 RepID=A0A1M7PPM2_9ACTN|nr:hypothetical protein SAMN05443668_103547 [Cryptosporangium aurantiacum]